jgi:serine/threonine-protein kinase
MLARRYRLDARIGTGGMSTVWRAFDTVLERPVAIKLMHREVAAAEGSSSASAARRARWPS